MENAVAVALYRSAAHALTQVGHARLAITKAFGEGVVASRTIFDPEAAVPVLPVPLHLAGLSEAPKRDSAIG